MWITHNQESMAAKDTLLIVERNQNSSQIKKEFEKKNKVVSSFIYILGDGFLG